MDIRFTTTRKVIPDTSESPVMCRFQTSELSQEMCRVGGKGEVCPGTRSPSLTYSFHCTLYVHFTTLVPGRGSHVWSLLLPLPLRTSVGLYCPCLPYQNQFVPDTSERHIRDR